MSDTSLDLFERVVRARGVAYSEWTPGEDRIQASPALAALFDLDPEDWTVQRLMDHIHPDDAKGYRAGLTSFMKSDADRAEIAVRYRRRNGGISWILNHNYAERDPSGRVTRLTTTSTEVTQEKEREAENRALLARQAASVEVLKAITASPDDPQPVFELIVRRACELCNAQAGNLVEYDGTLMHQRTLRGFAPEAEARLRAVFPRPPGLDTLPGRVVLTGQRIHLPDAQADQGLIQQGRGLGARAFLGVPLLREGQVIGVLGLARFDPGDYDQSAIELVQSFAEQAVIAIAGAKTLREPRDRTAELAERNDAYVERIAHQSATIDVLKAMSASPGDPQPVFDLIAERARDICGGYGVTVTEFDSTLIHHRASTGVSEDPAIRDAAKAAYPMPPTRDRPVGRAILDRKISHIRDNETEPGLLRLSHYDTVKSSVTVPLMRGGMAIGALAMGSRERGGFSDTQVELLKTFAEQAVIAIGSAETWRALRDRTSDLQESLEYQTATGDVLKVISRSTFDLQPVLTTLVETAARLCDAEQAVINRREGDAWRFEANFGFPPEFEIYVRSHGPTSYGPDAPSVAARAARERRPVHIHDVAAVPGYPDVPITLGRQRTSLGVPLMREGEVIGTIVLARQRVEPFTERQIDLVSTFADQAVIAIENTRLLTEQQEALEQQTATAEVLQVINASPENLTPVFEAILEKAHRICHVDTGSLWTYDGTSYRIQVSRGYSEQAGNLVQAPSPEWTAQRRLLAGDRYFHAPDMAAYPWDADDKLSPTVPAATGGRAVLVVALRKDGVFQGHITNIRREPGPFSDKEIALLENFAAQAVIAMENARLLTEQKEALEQQTATAEVLGVINRSPGNLVPVFEAILEKAHTLCGAAIGSLYRYDGEFLHVLATHGFPEEYAALIREPVRPPSSVRTLIEGASHFHVPDIKAIHPRPDGIAGILAEKTEARATLAIPLRKDGTFIGHITAIRTEARPFTAKEIALLENFAAQAVIAMENARLINEQRDALERQTATAEVLEVINASAGNLAPVFDVILEKALRICQPAFGTLNAFDCDKVVFLANRGTSTDLAEYRAKNPGDGLSANVIRMRETRRSVHLLDIREGEAYRAGHAGPRAVADLGGARTLLLVPLLKEQAVVGSLQIYRREVRAFTDNEISLLENFAAQAVIAMENARLINEQREALEQQTATAEVLQVINASAGDLMPVFDTIVEKAHALCGASVGSLMVYDGTIFRAVATHGYQADTEALLRRGVAPTAFLDPLFRGERICVRDAGTLDWSAQHRDVRTHFEKSGVSSILVIPLLKEQALLGYITNASFEARSFSDKQITLLKNFAAQAVIAMESARLLNELRARTEELAQRQAELHVTFENMGDGVAMFDQTQHLVAWNRKFQDLLDVPDDIIAQRRSLPEYVRYLAERGEFGTDADVDEQVRRVLHTTGQMRVFERVRPNGSVIEVHSNPIAGGGFVLIYSDITERKRNEEAIHVARDAAEEASRTIEAAFRELKTAQANLIQAEKMASLGQLTAGIAHEIKNPLNFVNNFAILSVELLSELKEGIAAALALLPEDRRADVEETVGMLTGNLEKITEHGKRADGIVKAMLEHSRGASGERRTVDINVLADEALSLAYHGERAQDQSFDISLERDFGGEISPIEVNPQDMTRVFLNLFSNGFYAAKKRERNGADDFRPTLKVTTRAIGAAVEIRVRDNGTGIPGDIRDKLFQPFFTTKPTGEGTGFGLSITYDIVTKAHGGMIAVDSEIDEFTEFVVTLPRGMFSNEGSRA